MILNSPRVSVLIVTYNRSQFIGRAIESVLAQTFREWELIIADDGSTDSTEEVCQNWEKKDRRIRYFHGPHFGRIAKISNFGLKEARGKYVAILDDDDWWIDSRKLEKQAKFLDENKEYVGCGGGFIVVDESGREKLRTFKPEKDENIKRNALVANSMVNATTLFRLETAKKVGFYDESMLQFADWDFWLKMGLEGKLYNFREHFTCYRMWKGGMSFSRQKETSASAIHIVNRYRRNYPQYPLAIFVSFLYFLYIHLPAPIKKFLNPTLSRLKKIIFSK